MKEFVVYTGLRLLLFVAAFAAVYGAWAAVAGGDVPVFVPLVVAMLLSGLGSVFLLQGPRERLAARIEERAARATARFEEMRSKED